MKKNNYLLLCLLLCVLLQSCYGYVTSVDYTAIKNENCNEKPKLMYLFFEGEELPFNYEKLGVLEVEGERYASNSEVLEELKREAWGKCANGLIKINSGYKEREQGVVFVSETEETYRAKFYTAIAVKISLNEDFIAKYGEGLPVTFKEK
ncbi:hypothetical protein [uncultured Tenacibaculum sp.]|uniref:hypothetical protein n=1 Tax=uncultured Tenacibaculum sp. TaxID=174713 RepID=UPI002606D2B4|nr:hypothetical protein [uncultured Tenacibaculum sp.]